MKSFKEFAEACWKGYTQYGMKMKNGKKVPNCIPVKEEGEAPVNSTGPGIANFDPLIEPGTKMLKRKKPKVT